jgi:KUP system potassium uptake protein
MSSPGPAKLTKSAKTALCLGALGVVFGDIGTSPLYTMRECIARLPEGVDRMEGILGILSLISWTLFLVVSVKYLFFVTKADNRGEGGIFALLALSHAGRDNPKGRLGFFIVVILAGAALLYGDGIITPAISVLSAAEGFKAIVPDLSPSIIVAIACVILAGLFYFQHKGSKNIGGVFGPVMVIWFLVIGLLGLWQIIKTPNVLTALNPWYGYNLLAHMPVKIGALLGSVVLAITGAEALYADMGHFGRKYIAAAWYGAAFPGLLCCYFGQGAYAIAHPEFRENPFFALAPAGIGQVVLIGLSIAATIIASQALISGTYSLTRQAIQLGYFPRLKISYTNAAHSGQIYVPLVNTLLAFGSIATVFGFGSSDKLAAAYGIAVTGTMAVTTIAYFVVIHKRWQWSLWIALPLCGLFLIIDLVFFGANIHKIADGGWFPLAIGGLILAIMHTWKTGKNEIVARVYGNEVTEDELVSIVRSPRVTRVSGSAVFMAGNPRGTPLALLHHLKANKSLQQTVVLLSVITEEVPLISGEDRLSLKFIGEGVWRATGRYGYMESPDVAALMETICERGAPLKPRETTYYFNREMIITGGDARMWEWEKGFYALLSRNARPAKDYYKIPPTQIIELGLPVQL